MIFFHFRIALKYVSVLCWLFVATREGGSWGAFYSTETDGTHLDRIRVIHHCDTWE